MVRLLILFLTLAAAPNADADGRDFFEGEVSYRIEVESKRAELSEDEIYSQLGTGFTMVFKDGDYLLRFEGGAVDRAWFRTAENMEYTLLRGEDFLRVSDGAEEHPKPRAVTAPPGGRTLLGRETKTLRIDFTDGSATRFWFDPSLRIDPDWFRELKIAGLYLFFEAAESLYLEYFRETSVFDRRYVATAVTPRDVAAEELQIPDLPRRDFDWRE